MRSHRGDSVFDETQYQRLRTLADSVNETARMARTTLSILLLVTLYLALTLGASTDENLFRNGQVVLPQVGAGLPVVQSYILAPLIFVCMHAHLLFIMSVLTRKVRTFEGAVKEDLSATKNLHIRATKRREYRDWLSSFVFVQRLLKDVRVSWVLRILSWLAISAIPLALLFVIDLSFVRYQSHAITWGHHIIFVFDLVLVTLFHWQVSGKRVKRVVWRFVISVKSIAFNRRLRGLSITKLLGWIWNFINLLFALAMVLLLIFVAHPPDGTENQSRIWRDEVAPHRGSYRKMSDWPHLLDDIPCYEWGIACRYLELNNFKKTDKKEELSLARRTLRFAKFKSAQLQEADFFRAQLQGAVFDDAELQKVNFQHAKLQGTDFKGAKLQKTKFQHTQLQEASFWQANLQGANFQHAKLEGARFPKAELQGVNFSGLSLQGVNFSGLKLHGANFFQAKLHGANLSFAKLHGADFWEAELHGANLSWAEMHGANFLKAKLHGANLSFSKLHGANLSQAELYGANSTGAELSGANFFEADLQCISSKQNEWYLTWMYDARFSFSVYSFPPRIYKMYHLNFVCSKLPQHLDACIDFLIPENVAKIKLGWKESVLQKKHLSLKEHLKKQFENCPSLGFGSAKPQKKDMVFYNRKSSAGPPMNWPQPFKISSEEYLKALREWTVEFACWDIHTARSSFRRWNDKLFKLIGFQDRKVFDSTKHAILKALIKKRNDKKNCPGISIIPGDDWKRIREKMGNV